MAKSKRQRGQKKRIGKTVWTKDEEVILRRHREEWLELDGRDERNEFCVRVGEEIRDLCPEKYGVLVVARNKDLKEAWEHRFKAIKTWFNNHRGSAKQRRVFKFERKIQLRNVIAHYKHSEIEEEVMRLCPGEKPGSKIYFKYYQKALSKIRESIEDPEELAFFEEKRKEWQSEGPPPEIQQRTAKKYGKRIILNMHEVAFKQMGMNAITIEAHRNENGDLGVTFHDYNRDLAGPDASFQSFLEFDRKACATFSKAFGEWIVKVLEIKDGREDPLDNDLPAMITLKKGPGGVPILPPPVLGNSQIEHLKTKRSIIRQFFKMHYRLASNKETVSPPWDSMGSSPDRFFNPEHVPAGFIFRDPTRMSGTDVCNLLQHLRDRQSQETAFPFSFHHVLHDKKFVKERYPKDANITCQAQPPISDINVDQEDSESENGRSSDSEEEFTPENPSLNLRPARFPEQDTTQREGDPSTPSSLLAGFPNSGSHPDRREFSFNANPAPANILPVGHGNSSGNFNGFNSAATMNLQGSGTNLQGAGTFNSGLGNPVLDGQTASAIDSTASMTLGSQVSSIPWHAGSQGGNGHIYSNPQMNFTGARHDMGSMPFNSHGQNSTVSPSGDPQTFSNAQMAPINTQTSVSPSVNTQAYSYSNTQMNQAFMGNNYPYGFYSHPGYYHPQSYFFPTPLENRNSNNVWATQGSHHPSNTVSTPDDPSSGNAVPTPEAGTSAQSGDTTEEGGSGAGKAKRKGARFEGLPKSSRELRSRNHNK